jgi:glucose-6-phosphate dehydrogenase assembly protein OpcA
MSETSVGPRHRVNMREVERELNSQMKALQGKGPLRRARMSNLVVFTDSLERSIEATENLFAAASIHPSRTILLVGEPGADRDLTARVTVRPLEQGAKSYALMEMVTLHAGGPSVERLPFAVRSLVLGDLPVNLLWATNMPPPAGGALMYDLAENAQQIIYDSLGWPDPARGMVATANWLTHAERDGVRWRVASDINWRRLKFWRRLLGQSLDPSSAPGAREGVTEVAITHGPHASIQAWMLASWLLRHLGGKVLTGKVTPGVEMAWRCWLPKGEARIRVIRAEEGPPAVLRMRVAYAVEGRPSALVLTRDGSRLSAVEEGGGMMPRTVTAAGMSMVEMIGRQLSDRERDPAFRESMETAGGMARGLVS